MSVGFWVSGIFQNAIGSENRRALLYVVLVLSFSLAMAPGQQVSLQQWGVGMFIALPHLTVVYILMDRFAYLIDLKPRNVLLRFIYSILLSSVVLPLLLLIFFRSIQFLSSAGQVFVCGS